MKLNLNQHEVMEVDICLLFCMNDDTMIEKSTRVMTVQLPDQNENDRRGEVIH